jgi:hypothetical protein
MRENFSLAALGVKFQQITSLSPNLGHIVKTNGIDIRGCDHLHEFSEVIKSLREL